MWASASDWALRRLLKVLLKRNLKGVLETEIDVEQLRVSLGSGALELTDVLISKDWLAERAPPGLEIVSGYIGRLRLDLALTSLTCSVALEDVLLTVRPGASPGAGASAGATAPADAAPGQGAASAAGAAGFGIDEGVRLVAAGVETLLQRMTVTVTRLSVRAELAPAGLEGPGCAAATLSCAQLSYSTLQEDCQAAAAQTSMARRVTFSGLSVSLQAAAVLDEGASSAGPRLLAPLDGDAVVRLSWQLGQLQGQQVPLVSLAVRLEALAVQLRPPDVAALLVLGRGFADAHSQAQAAEQVQALQGAEAGGAQQQQQQRQGAVLASGALASAAAGHHSFFEDLMLPECEGMVQDALMESAASGITGQEEVDEFFDAKSLLGSLQQAFTSAMAASHTSAAGDASVVPGGTAGHAGDDLDIFAMHHHMAASIREVGGELGKQWSTSVSLPSFNLSLLYPQEAGCTSQHYTPRLVVEVLDLALAAESASVGGTPSSDSSSSSLSITAGVVEVAEHLPFPSQPSPASSAASSVASTACGWLPAEEMARVPAVLPSTQHLRWPTPVSAGDYPLPDEASSLGISDTLAQLTDLSQATVYQSATMTESSMLQQSLTGHEACAVPRVQVVPVLLCSGQGAAVVLHCAGPVKGVSSAQRGGQEAAAAGADVALLLQPVCLWCTLPLVAHLQAFGALVAQHYTEAAAATGVAGAQQPASAASPAGSLSGQGGQREPGGGCSKAAVAAAINDIMQGRSSSGPQLSAAQAAAAAAPPPPPAPPTTALRLSVYLPGACVVAAVPGAAPCLPKYFAVEAQGSSSQLLASLGHRMGNQQAQALVSTLRESGVEPTLVLQKSGNSGGSSSSIDGSGSSAPCSWACTLRTGAVAVQAVGDASAEREMGDSVLGHPLGATRVASIAAGDGSLSDGGLSIHGSWQQPGITPLADELESLWVSAGLEPGCQPGPAALWAQLSAASPLLVSVRSGAAVEVALERDVLEAAARLVDGLLQLSAAPPPVEAAARATVRVECEVLCVLLVPHGSPCTLAARSILAVAGSTIGGLAGSSVAALSVGGVELTRPGPAAGPGRGDCLLAHAGGQHQADGRRMPAAHLFALLRPTGEPCVLSSAGRYVLPCRGRVALCTAGLTVVLDESAQLGWANDLQALFAAGTGSPGAAVAAGPPPTTPTLDLGVCLLGSAVRYEPRDTSLAAAVLTAGSIGWRVRQGQRHSMVDARRLALHVAGSRAAGRAASSPGAGQRGVQASLADVAGFHQVAAEAGLSMQLPAAPVPTPKAGQQQQQGQQQRRQQQGQQRAAGHVAQPQAMQEVLVTNQGLSITLSRHTLLLLQRLARQLPARGGNMVAAPSATPAPATGRCSPGPEGLASSAATGASWSSVGGQTGVNVMQGVVQSAYTGPRRPPEHPLEASVFLDGGWYDPHQQANGEGTYIMSPAGSPPAMVDAFLHNGADAGRAGAALEGQGVWYGAEAGLGMDMQDDYVALQAPNEDAAATSPGSPSYDCRVLPPNHPPPLRRLSLRDLNVTLTLADTFATVLLPEDDELDVELEVVESPRQEHSHQPQGGHHGSEQARQAGGADSTAWTGQAGGQHELEHEEVVVPLSAQVQARLEGVCLQLDSFAATGSREEGNGQGLQVAGTGAAAPHMRCALMVRTLEVRDSFQPRKGGGSGNAAAAAAAATGWAGLRRMLGYHASVHRVRDAKANQVQVLVEAVRTEPGTGLEYRVHVHLLPLLLHLDQAALLFLAHFFAPDNESIGSGESATGSVGIPGPHVPEPFFQRCEVQPFTLTINYRPHRVDLAALSSGQLTEVLNLVPWGGVTVHFRHLRLFGMMGLGGVGTAVASAYIEDITRFQKHRFVNGIAPIASICRISTAAAQLLAIPRHELYKHSSGGGNGLSLSALADEDFRRQMQRGLAGFVRAVALEAINLGATMAAGAEVALTGEPSASHTAGVKQALRQASAHLRSTSNGPRTTASAAATAVRTALLGVRNTLDKEHTIERRMNL